MFMCDSERIIQVCVDENGHWDGDEGRMELHVRGGQMTSLAYSGAVHRKLCIYKDAFFVVTEDTTSLYNLRGRIPMVWWLTCL